MPSGRLNDTMFPIELLLVHQVEPARSQRASGGPRAYSQSRCAGCRAGASSRVPAEARWPGLETTDARPLTARWALRDPTTMDFLAGRGLRRRTAGHAGMASFAHDAGGDRRDDERHVGRAGAGAGLGSARAPAGRRRSGRRARRPRRRRRASADPYGIALDPHGPVYIADAGDNNRIRVLRTDGSVVTLAGGTEGFRDGLGAAAQFDTPSGRRSMRPAICMSPTPATTRSAR